MNEPTLPPLTKLEGICPVCGQKLVRVMRGDKLQALAHRRPLCEVYTTLTMEAFNTKYLIS